MQIRGDVLAENPQPVPHGVFLRHVTPAGGPPGQDRRGKIAGTGLPGQDCEYRRAIELLPIDPGNSVMKVGATPTLLVSIVMNLVPVVRANQPNIVLILADDLGYGDLACYGSLRQETPHIDRLATGGVRFTDFHSNGPMCSATRAALLTGCYQQRFGPEFDGALGPSPRDDNGLPLAAVTIAEVLQQVGYATGMYGKWHLGYRPPLWPTQQGFDEFVGLGSGDGDHHTQIDRSGQQDWWKNDVIRMESAYTTDLITDHSVDFIRRHRKQPFFLYVAHLAIHFPWQGRDDLPHRVQGTNYSNDKWGIIPDRHNVAPHVKAMIEAVDQSVGKIVSALDECGLSENTLVVFASDNGGYLQYADSHFNISSNGPLKGQKGEVHEGGHRVPCIARWPGRIPPGRTSAQTVLTMDFFPTFASLAGAKLPTGQQLDGRDIGPLLLDDQALAERMTFWRNDEQRAARLGRWKLNLSPVDRSAADRSAADGPRLYNLNDDLGETTNVAAENPAIVSKLRNAWFAWERDVNGGFQ